MESITLQKRRLAKILQIWEMENPDPKCELFYKTPFQLLVSVVLSAQATDKGVNKAMTALYEAGFDMHTVLSLGPQGVYEKIKTIGLAKTKSKNIYNLSKMLLEKYAGIIPHTKEELMQLPGVGQKTANVILGELFSKPTLAVDTHVFRVGKRLGFHRETQPLKAEEALLKLIEPKFLPKAHHWFILHGRYTCKAKNPACGDCKIRPYCTTVTPT